MTQHEGAWPKRFERAAITLDATGSADGLTCALRSTLDYGTCTMASIVFGDASVPLLEMYTRGVTLLTSRADSRRYLPEVLRLAEDGRFDPLAIPTTIVEWDHADEAWLAPATKLVIVR
ncbi:MAG: hypothetical protein NVS3B12_32770 [Acidimicrobiales bacterium]